MDYAVYDALAAGFTKVVFVIRHDFEADFRKGIGSKYENRVAVDYVFQGLDTLPPASAHWRDARNRGHGACDLVCSRARARAVPVGERRRYYGKNSYRIAAQHLVRPTSTELPEYCLVGFPVLQTLSEHGSVARAICDLDGDGFLKGLVERTKVEKSGTTGRYPDDDGTMQVLRGTRSYP